MKKKTIILSVLVLVLAMLAMAACSNSSFGVVTNDDKTMTITAENSEKDDSAVSGTLVVGEDEQITIDSNLESGGMKLEFISNEGFDDPEEVPDIDEAQAAYTANVNGVESQAVMFGAGSYLVRATVTEKASGTVDIVVKGFGE